METVTPGVEERLRGELSAVLDLIRDAGPTNDDASVVRGALIDQANKLAETLERIRYGAAGS